MRASKTKRTIKKTPKTKLTTFLSPLLLKNPGALGMHAIINKFGYIVARSSVLPENKTLHAMENISTFIPVIICTFLFAISFLTL